MIRVSRGLAMNTAMAILLAVIGVLMLIMALSGLWIIFPFSILCLGGAGCTGGIEFDPANTTYREYTVFLGIKTGKWKSYEGFCFISSHPATLSHAVNMARTQQRVNTYEQHVQKVILLNREHNRKLFVKYAKDNAAAQTLMQKLAGALAFTVVTYHPPIPESRLRRMRKNKT